MDYKNMEGYRDESLQSTEESFEYLLSVRVEEFMFFSYVFCEWRKAFVYTDTRLQDYK